jgi:DNA-binding IclR family transcriptional regulator
MFTLMDVLASREEPVSLKEISESTGLHPSTAHRILNDLAIGRFVERPETGSYRLGMRLLELGNLVKGPLSVRDAALVPMRELHKLHPAARQPERAPGRRDRLCRTCLQRALGHAGGAGHWWTRTAAPHLHRQAFSGVDDAQRVRAYATRTGLAGRPQQHDPADQRWSANWPRRASTAYARDNEELELGVRCMAAGIRTMTKASWWPACRSLPRPTGWMSSWLPKLQATAASISEAMGYPG